MKYRQYNAIKQFTLHKLGSKYSEKMLFILFIAKYYIRRPHIITLGEEYISIKVSIISVFFKKSRLFNAKSVDRRIGT